MHKFTEDIESTVYLTGRHVSQAGSEPHILIISIYHLCNEQKPLNQGGFKSTAMKK